MRRADIGIASLLVICVNLACTSTATKTAAEEPAAAHGADRCPASGESCSALFAPDAKAPDSPRERFETRLTLIQNAVRIVYQHVNRGDIEMSLEDRKALIKAFRDDDVRGSALQLQELEAIYSEIFKERLDKKDQKKIKKQRTKMKNFEGILGDYMRSQELLKFTAGSDVLKKQAPGASKVIEDLAGNVAEKTMLTDLKKIGWADDPFAQIDKVREQLKHFKFKKIEKDQRQYVKAMRERVALMMNDIADIKKAIDKNRYDLDDLDEGLHYMRRRLREVVMMFGNADGIFKYTRDGATSQQLADMEKFMPYAHGEWESAPTLKTPAEFPLYLILNLEYLVGKLGELKDFKEKQLDLQNVLIERMRMSQADAEKVSYQTMVEYFQKKNATNEKEAEDEKKSSFKHLIIPDPNDPATSIEKQTQGFFYNEARQGAILDDVLGALKKGHESLKEADKSH